MRADEFESWCERARAQYAADMVRAGLDEERAQTKAVVDFEALLPDGVDSADTALFVVELDGERAGSLWLAVRDNPMSGRHLFVFAVEIAEQHRRRGLGRAAMEFAEQETRRRGLSKIELNVFGGNDVARGLYRSLGYDETAIYMVKQL